MSFFCPKCDLHFAVYVILFDTSNHPVEKNAEPRYCPHCGWSAVAEPPRSH